MSSYSTTVFSQSFYLVVVRSCLPMVLTISHGVKGRWWEFFIRIAILTAWSIAFKTAPASMWILLFASPRKKQRGVDRVRVIAVNILYAYTLIQQPFRLFYCLSLYKNTYVACEKCRALIKVRPLHRECRPPWSMIIIITFVIIIIYSLLCFSMCWSLQSHSNRYRYKYLNAYYIYELALFTLHYYLSLFPALYLLSKCFLTL